MKKLNKSEILSKINNNDKIKIYDGIYAIDFNESEQFILMNNGYKRKCGKNICRTNPFKLTPFLDKEYGIENLEIWLNNNRPNIKIVERDIKIYNTTKIKLFSSEWNMEFTMSLYEILNFKTPRKQYDTSSISKCKISEEEFYERVNKALIKDCYKDYKLISDYNDYFGNSTRLIFKHKTEGWLSSRKFTDLNSENELILFTSKAKELSTLNMKNYLTRYMRHLKLCDGQFFVKKQYKYKLRCKFHGEFEVDWNNFYERRQDCPGCVSESKSRGETFINDLLIKHNIEFKREIIFDGFVSEKNKPYRFDFGIYINSKLSGIIEFHGPQHYNQTYGYFAGKLSKIQEVDLIKKDFILNNNIKYLEVRYNEANKERLIINFVNSLK